VRHHHQQRIYRMGQSRRLVLLLKSEPPGTYYLMILSVYIALFKNMGFRMDIDTGE